MHDISSTKESEESSIHSTSPCVVSCPSWWTLAGSGVPLSSTSRNLNLNLDSAMPHCHYVKQLGPQLQDQDSSSTRSTSQSQHEAPNVVARNSSGQCGTEYDETLGKQVNVHMKSVLTLGASEFVFPSSKVDYTQSVACIPYPYADPFVGGVLAAYGPQAFMHPQMMGIQSTRVPLPVDFAEEEPIYVNSKQYHGILRRRQSRAKLEAQNKLVKARKPYLHESRHLHAMKRARGSGGRFLNTKRLQQLKPLPSIKGDNVSGDSLPLQPGGSLLEPEVLQSENSNMVASATCSEVTSASNKDILLKANLGFSGFHSHAGGSLRHGGSIMHGGTQHRVSVIH